MTTCCPAPAGELPWTCENDHISRFLGDLVPEPLRSSDCFVDLISWDLCHFNSRDERRLETLAGVLMELNADILAFQRIEHGSLDDLAECLNAARAGLYRVAYGGTGGDQRLALMYDTEWVKATSNIEDLFQDEEDLRVPGGRKRVFPRLPMHASFEGRTLDSTFDFHMVVLDLHSRPHLARDRRASAFHRLVRWLEEEAAGEPVIVAGDWNAPFHCPEWELLNGMAASGAACLVGLRAPDGPSHLFRHGNGCRMHVIAVADEARQVAPQPAVNLFQWRDELRENRELLRGIVGSISEQLPALTRVYFLASPPAAPPGQ